MQLSEMERMGAKRAEWTRRRPPYNGFRPEFLPDKNCETAPTRVRAEMKPKLTALGLEKVN